MMRSISLDHFAILQPPARGPITISQRLGVGYGAVCALAFSVAFALGIGAALAWVLLFTG
jgi:hypothetical protein